MAKWQDCYLFVAVSRCLTLQASSALLRRDLALLEAFAFHCLRIAVSVGGVPAFPHQRCCVICSVFAFEMLGFSWYVSLRFLHQALMCYTHLSGFCTRRNFCLLSVILLAAAFVCRPISYDTWWSISLFLRTRRVAFVSASVEGGICVGQCFRFDCLQIVLLALGI